MRIIKFLLKSSLILVLSLVTGGLIAREVILFLGVNRLKSSLTTLRRTQVSGGYYDQCRRKGAVPIGGETYATLQLRFISDQVYVLEILCNQYSFDPIVIKEESLPIFVHKVAGDAGIIWGEELSGVKIEVLGRQAAVGVEAGKIVRLDNDQALGLSPETTCSGFGFSCCQLESEVGQGQELKQVTDCPRSCYESCQDRPVVLALRTQPVTDQTDRLMTIETGQTVIFHYVLAEHDNQDLEVTLDYGDGQQEVLSQREATVSHTYQCQDPACRYQFRLTAEDEAGIQNADLPISSLQVVVK